jgi:hypothetical protein
MWQFLSALRLFFKLGYVLFNAFGLGLKLFEIFLQFDD